MKNSWLNKDLRGLESWGPKKRRMLLALLALVLPVLQAAAQASTEPEMADAFRADGKIYVVVAVVAVVLAGLLFFLISLDRKLTRLEREVRE